MSRPKEDRKRNDRSETPEDKRKVHESVEKEKESRSPSREREDLNKRSPSREKVKESSPKVSEKEEKEKKKDKDKDKKKKKKEKEKETEEERAARKKRKREKKEEKKRKQEMKASESKIKTEEPAEEETKAEPAKAPEPAPNFVSTFKEVPAEELKSSPATGETKFDSSGDQTTLQDSTEDPNEEYLEPGEIIEPDETIEIKDDNSEPERKLTTVISRDNSEAGDDNVELEIHASYESLLEEAGENQKKGILVQIPEKSKWELDEGQTGSDSNQKQKLNAVSPERKVTREVIKRAENAIFKRAVNAIREPTKKSEKEEKKERKVIVAPEKDRRSREKEVEVEKVRRVYVQKESKDKDKIHRSTVEVKYILIN